jgi:hypothetical protein
MATVIYPGGHFTHCVHPNDFHLPDPFYLTGPASAGKAACDYLLGGKLVCMSPDPVCAIGTIIGLEGTSYGKSGFDAIDNDFSFNLLLAPYRVEDFRIYANYVHAVDGQYAIRDDVARNAPKGHLLIDRAGVISGLSAREPKGKSPLDGYGVMWHFPDPSDTTMPPERAADPNEDRESNLNKLGEVVSDGVGLPGVSIPIPVLHCECEGSRIWAVCNAMAPFLDVLSGKPPGSPGPSVTDVCHKALGWIPFVGDLLCAIAEAIVDIAMFPIVLAMAAAAAVAWAAAQAYDDLFLTGPVKAQIHQDDVVVVQGRWTWDSGHAGHMELHPVVAIAIAQGVRMGGSDPTGPVAKDVAAHVKDLEDRWCRLLNEAPPAVAPPTLHGAPPVPGAELTADQQATALAQLRPENQWSVHPLIDGCAARNEDVR